VRHSSDGPTTPDSPLRPSRRGPRGMLLTPRRFSHCPVFARLWLPTRRQARAMWLIAHSAVTLPSTGPRESSSYDPKTSEGGNVQCTLPRSSRVFVFLPGDERRRESHLFTPDVGFNILAPCLREPSANGPKVVSPIVAPRSLGPILERGASSTPWTPSASRIATLRAGRRDGS
jgi:hypothetical protein